jgi:CheY-like chemotaxis protein
LVTAEPGTAEEWGRVAPKPKILSIGQPSINDERLLAFLRDHYEVVEPGTSVHALALLAQNEFAGVHVFSSDVSEQVRLGSLLQHERILSSMPDGLVLLDQENRILWANDCIRKWSQTGQVIGDNFYTVFNRPEILGPDFCPFNAALTSNEATYSTIRCADNRYFQLHAVPVRESEGEMADATGQTLIVTVHDVTTEVLQQQKLAAIHKAGIELADLTTEEIFHMKVQDRIDLLKENILRCTRDVLAFDVVEVRLLGQQTRELVPLLSEGMCEAAAQRKLFAEPQGYGVTGFVAATGTSYLCEDTIKDPLYIEGSEGAKSSLTVPLIQHDQVIGTFNVESPKPRAFTESDLQFLEIFSRDVAAALNTLELLVAQQANTAQASVEAIHREVALPVDEILNDAVNVVEKYIGHEPGVVTRLRRILQNARDIKQLIHKVGQELAPAEAVPSYAQIPERTLLRGRRVLVVDEDESVRSAAHDLLERFGCTVETAHAGGEAVFMIRYVGHDTGYDVIISDIRLPDMSGYELLLKLKEIMDPVPLVLMKGFGYDPGHAIVNARREGLLDKAVLYKPFRLDQLLEVVERVIQATEGGTTG